MNKVIIFKNKDGSCGIIVPAPQMFDPKSKTRQGLSARDINFENDEETLNWIAAKDVPAGLEWRITDQKNVPTDRTFRNAWTDNNPTETVDVDIIKARKVHMDFLKVKRDEKLKTLDLSYMRADELGDAKLKKDIAAKKQLLRDMPKDFDLSKINSVDELKSAIPDYLAL